MDTTENIQFVLTNGYVEFEAKPFPRFLVYNHKPQIDKPLFMNKKDLDKLFANVSCWQNRLVDTQTALDAGCKPKEYCPYKLAVFGKNCISLNIQTYNEKAYLWLKLYYFKDDKWFPAKGGLMISEKDNFEKFKEFVGTCN